MYVPSSHSTPSFYKKGEHLAKDDYTVKMFLHFA